MQPRFYKRRQPYFPSHEASAKYDVTWPSSLFGCRAYIEALFFSFSGEGGIRAASCPNHGDTVFWTGFSPPPSSLKVSNRAQIKILDIVKGVGVRCNCEISFDRDKSYNCKNFLLYIASQIMMDDSSLFLLFSSNLGLDQDRDRTNDFFFSPAYLAQKCFTFHTEPCTAELPTWSHCWLLRISFSWLHTWIELYWK